MHTQELIKKDISAALEELGIGLTNSDVTQWIVERTDAPTFGDFSSNAAMQLFRLLSDENKKEFKQPRVFAQAIVEKLQENAATKDRYTKVEVAGPGFINFFVSPAQIWNDLFGIVSALTDSQKPVITSEFTDKKVLVEYTDPNPFKELHIGHGYSNIVGESIARLFEVSGANVLRVCYQGDVGMHVAKSVWGMQHLLEETNQDLADIEKLPLSQRIAFLGKSYAKGATAYEEDELAQKEIKEINFSTYSAAQQRLVAEEGWEPQVDYTSFLKDSKLDHAEISRLYQHGRAWSLSYFDTMYAKLGMQFDDFFFESLVGEYGAQIVHEYVKKGIFKESQGAIIFPGSEYGLHDRVFINSLGLPTYEAKELGLAPEKYRRHKYDHSVIITGNEIKEYFKVLLTAMKQTHPELQEKTHHLSHGMVRLPEGKMSSRTGKVLTTEWLLTQAQEKIVEQMTQTRPDWSDADRAEAAEAISVGAIKFAFLKQSIGGDIAFSFDESLSFTGQSGPYLQYMYVRCSSILATILETHGESSDKGLVVNQELPTLIENSIKSLEEISDQSSLAVAQVLSKYPSILKKALAEYAPHHVALYAFELAQAFSAFYDSAPILQEEDIRKVQQRIAVLRVTQLVLQNALHVLGIATLNKM